MPTAFLCHAPSDAALAGELAAWLELHSPCRTGLVECGAGTPHDLIEGAEQAMSADAVILLLSPDAVPAKWVRSRWEPTLVEQPVEAGIGVACLLLAECKFPELLRRRDFFVDGRAGRRELKRWLLARFPSVVALPAAGPSADPTAIEDLRQRLADAVDRIDGVPHELALAFARDCTEDFEGVVWVDGSRRTPAGLAADLAHALGLNLSGPPEEVFARLGELCRSRRLLLGFDRCADAPIAAEGKCSVLVTAPREEAEPRPADEVVRVFAQWMQAPEDCLALLRDVAPAVAALPWNEARGLAYSALALLRHAGRDAELLELVDLAAPLAQAAGDASALRHFDWESSWIRQAWGRTEAVTAPMLPPPPGEQLTFAFPIG